MYNDHVLDRMVAGRVRQSRKSVLLLGPRQVGKSTLCRSLKPDWTLNLADEASFITYAKDPGRLAREAAAFRRPALIFIDEIQRVPALLNTVQALLDEDAGVRFVLTGSSAKKLKRGGGNLLPGRIVVEHLDPLSYWELGKDFELEKALRLGTLPGIYFDPTQGEEVLSAYASAYLREEIQAEALIRNIGAYARFLDLAAVSSGHWVNYSKAASDCEIPKETVRRFYTLLEETLVALRLPPFKTAPTRRKISQRDRFVLFDPGVRNALLGTHRHAVSPVEAGPLFEQWLILQCSALNRARHLGWTLSSYRTDAGAEVDLVIDRGDTLLAVECKWSRQAAEADLRGLRSLEEVAGKPVEKVVVYRGERRQRFKKGETAVPYQDFLDSLLPV